MVLRLLFSQLSPTSSNFTYQLLSQQWSSFTLLFHNSSLQKSLSSLHIFVHHCTFCASLHVKTSPAKEWQHCLQSKGPGFESTSCHCVATLDKLLTPNCMRGRQLE